jgi:hypothetical protein
MRVASPVPMMLSDTDQAWLFFLIAGALGACFIWAFWEIEQARGRRRRILKGPEEFREVRIDRTKK